MTPDSAAGAISVPDKRGLGCDEEEKLVETGWREAGGWEGRCLSHGWPGCSPRSLI
jgi:hypothetical protein